MLYKQLAVKNQKCDLDIKLLIVALKQVLTPKKLEQECLSTMIIKVVFRQLKTLVNICSDRFKRKMFSVTARRSTEKKLSINGSANQSFTQCLSIGT